MRYRSLALCLFGVLSLACRTTNSSDVKQETDDRPLPGTEKLVDVSNDINAFFREQIALAKKAVNPSDLPWDDKLKQNLVEQVFQRTGKARAGTGIGVHFWGLNLEVSTLTEVEVYLIDKYKNDPTKIHQTKFADSRYGDNPIGLTKALVISHATKETADHSISPVVRIGKTLVGLDKLGHFTAQGRWYYLAEKQGLLSGATERLQFGEFMEGSPRLDPELYPKYKKVYGSFCKICVVRGGFGYFGTESSGVASYADMAANEDGYEFFMDLVADPASFKFDIRNYDVTRWNESNNDNFYKEGLIVRP